MIREVARVILTPEHVRIRLPAAGLGSRFLAMLADTALVVALFYMVSLFVELLTPQAITQAVQATIGFVLFWGYHVYFETRHQGRSLGKKMAGLRVVDGKGLPISLRQSFIRNLVRALDFPPFFYGLGGLVCLLDSHNRRLGDIISDTLVITESQPLSYGQLISKSRRFNSLRTPGVRRRIRHRIALEEREFLLTLCVRAETLEERARFDLMEEVAETYRKKLEVDEPNLSSENFVRDLTSILYESKSPS